MLEKLNWFHLTSLITLVLLIWKWISLLLRRNHLLRCCDWLSFLNWIEALPLSLLNLPPRKLEPSLVLSFFLLRLCYVSINLLFDHAWNISHQNSPQQSAIPKGFAKENSVFIVITLAKIVLRWLFLSKIYVQFTIFNTYFTTNLSITNKRYHLHVLEKWLSVLQEVRSIVYFRQFIHPLSLRSHGNGTSVALTLYIIALVKFCNVTFLNNFYFVLFFYHFFICRSQRKIRLVTLSKSYLYKFFFQSFFLVYWASFFHIRLYFWTQINHPKLFLKHSVWCEKRACCIPHNNIWIWVK